MKRPERLSSIRLMLEAPLFRGAWLLMAGIVLSETLADAFPAIAGRVAKDFLPLSLCYALAAALTAIVAAVTAKRHDKGVLIWPSVVLFGAMLMSFQREKTAFPYPSGTQTLWLVVASEPTEKPHSICADVIDADRGVMLKCYLQKSGRSRKIVPGEGVLVNACVKSTDTLCYGTFRYGRLWRYRGIVGSCYASEGQWEGASVDLSRLPISERISIQALRFRHTLLKRFSSLEGLSESEQGILAAMTLGEKSSLSAQTRATFQVSGASHVLALSGLHMGILCFLISFLGITRFFPLTGSALTVLLLWAFALLTGLSTSVVRSALMLSIMQLLTASGRSATAFESIGLAATTMLLASPQSVFDVGFQLSFMAVLSLVAFVPVLNALACSRWQEKKGIVHAIASLLFVSFAAWLGTAPLVAYHFHQLPSYFLLTNLVAIPATYLILISALLLFVLPFPFIGKLLTLAVTGFRTVLEAISSWPHANISQLHPTVLQTVLAYILIGIAYAFAAYVARFKVATYTGLQPRRQMSRRKLWRIFVR